MRFLRPSAYPLFGTESLGLVVNLNRRFVLAKKKTVQNVSAGVMNRADNNEYIQTSADVFEAINVFRIQSIGGLKKLQCISNLAALPKDQACRSVE